MIFSVWYSGVMQEPIAVDLSSCVCEICGRTFAQGDLVHIWNLNNLNTGEKVAAHLECLQKLQERGVN